MHKRQLIHTHLLTAFLLCGILLHAGKSPSSCSQLKMCPAADAFVKAKPVVETSRFIPSVLLF